MVCIIVHQVSIFGEHITTTHNFHQFQNKLIFFFKLNILVQIYFQNDNICVKISPKIERLWRSWVKVFRKNQENVFSSDHSQTKLIKGNTAAGKPFKLQNNVFDFGWYNWSRGVTNNDVSEKVRASSCYRLFSLRLHYLNICLPFKVSPSFIYSYNHYV